MNKIDNANVYYTTTNAIMYHIFSSPEHEEVLMVSYCDQFVRRPSVINFLL